MLIDSLKRKGVSRAELARYAGVARDTLEKWASGESQPRPKTLHRLAEGLRKRARELMRLADEIDTVPK